MQIRILLVEDNPGDARLIQEMLTEEKFAIDSLERVDRLSKGLDRLAAGGIDAVLLDLRLPDSQGLSTFERIHEATKQVPILILTAFKDDTLALEAVRRGAQDYLIKGKVDAALLVRAITYAIERKKLDEAIKRQAELIDLSPDAVIIKKPDDTITFWSLGAEKLYGWTKAQAIGQNTNALFNPRPSMQLEDVNEQLKHEGKWSGEVLHQTKLGRSVSVQSYKLAKFNEHGEIMEIFESNVDITERKDAERLAAIGATAGMVGHDIRNPLQSIVGEIFLSKKEIETLPESDAKKYLKDSIQFIEENIFYIDKIVSDLQDYAKLLTPSIEETDFKKVVEDVFSTLKVPENINVVYRIEPSCTKLLTDSSAVKRILTNLCSNAIQAMPKGGKLTLDANCKDDKIFISVQDTGLGIPEETRDKLFKPLFTTKSKGQGFGLAVVKKLTEALNGKVSVESEVGKGTRFTVEFPLQKTATPISHIHPKKKISHTAHRAL